MSTKFELLRHDAVVVEHKPVQIVERDERGVALHEYKGYYNSKTHRFSLYPCRSLIATRSGTQKKDIDADLVRRPPKRCGA